MMAPIKLKPSCRGDAKNSLPPSTTPPPSPDNRNRNRPPDAKHHATAHRLPCRSLHSRAVVRVSTLRFALCFVASSLASFFLGSCVRHRFILDLSTSPPGGGTGLGARCSAPPLLKMTSNASAASTTGASAGNNGNGNPGSNPICDSTLFASTRQQVVVEIDGVVMSNARGIEILEGTDGGTWSSNDLLSYHCQMTRTTEEDLEDGDEDGGNLHCYGILRGGGTVVLRIWREGGIGDEDEDARNATSAATANVSLNYYSACGIGNRTATAVAEFVRGVEMLILRDDAEFDLIGGDDGEGKHRMTRTKWSHQLRANELAEMDWSERDIDPLHSDLEYYYYTSTALRKRQVVSAQSDFQQIDIYDILDPKVTPWESYIKSRPGDDNGDCEGSSESSSYESLHPELYRPNRIVFLDGTEQSTSRGNEPYHEALVHPGMFAHANPRRVAIIGGGEGATLREVLKHDTVDVVKMIEIDEVMVDYSRRYLPDWNLCGDLLGSTDSCFDDERADMRYEDAVAWFVDRFGDAKDDESRIDGSLGDRARMEDTESSDDDECVGDNDDDDDDDIIEDEEPFDVIIMDALDPGDQVEFADVLYGNDEFLTSLRNGLTHDGILVMQLGMSVGSGDAPEQYTECSNILDIIRNLHKLGFKSVHAYEESHCGFHYPWRYLLACRSVECNKLWFANAAMKDASIHRRIRRTHVGSSALRYTDGSTLASYHVAHQGSECLYCRSPFASGDDCDMGRGYHPELPLFSKDSFEVRLLGNENETSKTTAVGLFTKADIPKMSYIKIGEALQFTPRAMEQMQSIMGSKSTWNEVVTFRQGKLAGFLGVGLPSMIKIDPDVVPNVGPLGSSIPYDEEEELWTQQNMSGRDGRGPLALYYNVVMDRRRDIYAGALVSLRDISEGEELVASQSNYMMKADVNFPIANG